MSLNNVPPSQSTSGDTNPWDMGRVTSSHRCGPCSARVKPQELGGDKGTGQVARWGSHLGHVLGDDVKATLLLHNHPQQLHQVAVSELPARHRRAQGRVLGGIRDHPALLTGTEVSPPSCCAPHDGDTHVMTDASARKACAVASFLMHFTATLFPR